MGFAGAMVIGVAVETQRLIGGALLTSVLLGTYHRPIRQRRIVMFLDLANSTRLAEAMGELRGPRPHHPLLFRYRQADRRLRRRRARLCRRRGDRDLARDRRSEAKRAMHQVLLRDPAHDLEPRARLWAGVWRRSGLPGRNPRRSRRRQRMRRRQAPARLFRRHDERRGEALRVLQGNQPAPGDIGRPARV